MKRAVCFLVCVFLFPVIEPLHASAVEQSAATQFTLRRDGSNPIEIDSDPFGFFGFVQASDEPFTFEDETFFEFDIRDLSEILSASVTFEIVSRSPGNQILIARTFDISHYIGVGSPDVSQFGSGDYLDTLFVEAQPGFFQSRFKTFSLDVTSVLAHAIGSNQSYLGFRLHHPLDVTPGSDSVPNVDYSFDSARLNVIVPEPSVIMILCGGVLSLIVGADRRCSRPRA